MTVPRIILVLLAVAPVLAESPFGAESVIAIVPRDALLELMRWEVIDHLGEDGAAGKHAPLSA